MCVWLSPVSSTVSTPRSSPRGCLAPSFLADGLPLSLRFEDSLSSVQFPQAVCPLPLQIPNICWNFLSDDSLSLSSPLPRVQTLSSLIATERVAEGEEEHMSSVSRLFQKARHYCNTPAEGGLLQISKTAHEAKHLSTPKYYLELIPNFFKVACVLEICHFLKKKK